jgi:predicted metal-binding membrane protein
MIAGMGPAWDLAMWLVMVVAMMLPTALPAVRHVAQNTLRWRRRRAVASFVGVYLAIWATFGLAMLLAAPLISPIDSRTLLMAALLLAGVWQFTPQKHRALAACHRSVPLPPTGRAATRGVLRFGRINGLACLRSCWAMMLAMATVSSDALVMMLVLAGVLTVEKRSQRPRRTAQIIGVSLSGACALVALAGA